MESGYLRRCVKFLTGSDVEHFLLVVPLRQIAMSQGPQACVGQTPMDSADCHGRQGAAGPIAHALELGRCLNQASWCKGHSNVAALHGHGAGRRSTNHWTGGV